VAASPVVATREDSVEEVPVAETAEVRAVAPAEVAEAGAEEVSDMGVDNQADMEQELLKELNKELNEGLAGTPEDADETRLELVHSRAADQAADTVNTAAEAETHKELAAAEDARRKQGIQEARDKLRHAA
jgi:hypothetical protein